MSGRAAGVVTTSTAPWRRASTSSSGVVSTTSPRNAVWITRLVNLEDREKGFLGDLDCADLFHPLLSLSLLLEELPLARDVAAVALGGHVLAKRSDGLARDYLRADRRLDHDFEQLARDQLLKILCDLLTPLARLVPMDGDRRRVHLLAIQRHVKISKLQR